MKNKTIRGFITDLKTIYEKHEFINDFGFGFIEDVTFKKEGEEKVNYPYMFCIPSTNSIDEREVTYTIRIIMMDRVINYTDENFLDVLSDTCQYLQDVIAQFKYSNTPQDGNYSKDYYDIDLPISMTPFSDKFDDYVAGYTAEITIRLPQPLDRCIAPYNNFN